VSQSNRFEVNSTGIIFLLAFAFIQWAYPFPNVYADTGAFITVAGNGLIGNYRPIGYSWFLAFAHFIDPHPDVLVLLQTLLYFFSSLVLFLTVKRLFLNTSNWVWKVFFVFYILSPTCIYICNFVISDSLFISLTNLWLASLFWILATKQFRAVFWNALFLLLLLQTRYIALFYPLLTVITLFFAFFKSNKWRFVLYSGLQVVLFAAVIIITTWQTKKNIDVPVFSAFGGWQKANNAMHILPHVNLKPDAISDPEIRKIHAFVISHSPKELYPRPDSVVVTYLWSNYGPLKQYMFYLKGNGQKSYLHYWHLASQPLGKWADYMIKQYPLVFLRHYIYPNFLFLFSLSNEALFEFPGPSQQMIDWFEWENRPVKPHVTFYHDFLAATASKSYNILWCALLISAIALCFPRRLKLTSLQHRLLLLVSFFCIVYIAMSVYASPLVLRYLLVLRHSLVLVPFLTFYHLLNYKHKLK
ncbi:MAG TPA: hypothetical protein VD794_15865, partial [Flavisolibacter sp.]|nr:hypothetical protein [Flavisolibacter sp.]